jgi:hypothetical protein
MTQSERKVYIISASLWPRSPMTPERQLFALTTQAPSHLCRFYRESQIYTVTINVHNIYG